MSIKEKFITGILNHPWLVISVSLAISVLCSLGLQHLEVDSRVDAFMDDDYPSKIEHYQVLNDFTDSNNLQIIVVTNKEAHAEGARSTLLTTSGLTIVRQLTEEAWQIPYASRVDSLTNYQHTEASGDDLLVAALLDSEVDINTDVVARTSHIALNSESLVGQLLAADGSIAIINIEFSIGDEGNRAEVYDNIMSFVDGWLENYKISNPNYDYLYAGTLAFDHASASYVAQDGVTLVPLMLLFIIIVLGLLLRSVMLTAAATVVVFITGVASIGLLGWIGVKLDNLSYIAPIVIMTLAVADVVHLSLGVLGGKSLGKNKLDAIRYSMEINFWPIFLTSVTTALGVITFSLSDYPSLRNLGLAIAIGVIMAFLLTLTLLPALLTQVNVNATERRSYALFANLADWVIKYYRKILLLGGVICIFFVISAGKNILNDSPELLFKTNTPERQAVDLLKEGMSGMANFDVAIYSNEPSGATEARFLNDIADFKDWLKTQNGVKHVSSITDTIKRLNKSMHSDQQDYYRLPESQGLIAQYLLLYELSLPYGLDLANQLTYDKSATRLLVSTNGLYAAETVALKNQIVQWFAERNPEARVAFAGYTLLLQELALNHLMPSLAKGGAIAFLFISLILMLVFKDWRYGFVGVCANLVPVAMGYGLWAYINGLANFAVMCVAGVCLGVVVDFAVHFLSKYRFARLQNKTPDNAVRYAFDKVALPIWVTTIVLTGGFWVLALSPMSINAGMGLLTGIIIILAFAFDMLMLPAMLLWSERKQLTSSLASDR